MPPPDPPPSAIPFNLPSASSSSSSKPPSLNPLPANDVRLFITSLRLLDLDLRPDWPHIAVHTFSAKNADQRQRIAAAEWALFRLFELYDPLETAQKLQPFFPPLEPLQSLNLRAALFRCLSDLKKNGLLGRESVLRKTMLDECKGDRFYDVLALFSTLVLKKRLAATRPRNARAPVAYRLATASTLAPDAQRSLLPIAIAHKASLTALLRRKDEKRRLFTDFEALLDAKADEFNRRVRKCKDTPHAARPAVPQREADAVKRQLTDNWIGNQKWLSVMLHGDQIHAGDAFLTTRFDNVWTMVQTGRKMEDAAPEPGLLENLQSRVQEQQSRLQKWKTFHEELRKENTTPSSTAPRTMAPVQELKFDAHTQYQLPSKGVVSQPQHGRTLPSQYHDILVDMDAELLRVSTTKPNVSAPVRKRRTSSVGQRPPLHSRKSSQAGMLDGPPSPIRQRQPAFPKKRVGSIASGASATTPPVDSDANFAGRFSSMRISASATHPAQSPIRPVEAPPEIKSSPPSVSSPTPSHRYMSSTTPGPIFSHPILTLQMPPLAPEEALAEDIISAIGNATPSPVKKPQPRMSMSLMDRTRMSMSRTTSFDVVNESPSPSHGHDDDEDELPLSPSSPLGSPPANKHATLLERTLHSVTMAQSARSASTSSNGNLTTSASNSKPDRAGSHKSRSSLFPVNQFDTPRARKSVEAVEHAKSVEKTPNEDLFDDEIDYDRVFKSRPRIATSPIFSPEKDRFEFDDDDEVTGIDLGDVDVDMSDGEDAGGFTQSWTESPSRRTGRVR